MKDLIRFGKAYLAIRIVWEMIGIGLLLAVLVLMCKLFQELQMFVNMW